MLSLLALSLLAAEPRFIAPDLSDAILFNPQMGLYLQYPPMDATDDDWFMQAADIAYYRLDWAEVNPEPGVYTFEDYFGPKFDFWVTQHHKRLAFRVMCQNMHSARDYVTPKWVFDAGVPGVPHTAIRGQAQTDPAFWNDQYLDLQCEFIAKLGEYLDGQPGLEFVDIGSIGEWGEMHLARWTPAQKADTGYSEAAYIAAYRRCIDAYHAAFPQTLVFLNVGGQSHLTINDYAAIHGVNFRQDGLKPDGASYDCGTWLYGPYSRRGVICNFEFHSGYDEMLKKHWDVPTTIERGLSAPISYLNTNLFGGASLRNAPESARELLLDAARRIGYRFVLSQLEVPEQVAMPPERPSRLALKANWRNDGVAPCYQSFAVDWSLQDSNGRVVATDRVYPPTPTTLWWPGEEQQTVGLLRLPAGTAPGDYTLSVRMLLPETGQVIALGITGQQPDGSYRLGTVPVVAGEAIDPVAYQEDFEGDVPEWGQREGLTVAVVDGAGRDGSRALQVEGTYQNGWNYTSFRLPNQLQPGALYRLTGWMKLDSIDPPRKLPWLKLGINNADDKWLENYGSNPYDAQQLGTWQKLEALVDVPAAGCFGDIALEKGDNTTAVTIKMLLDDLRLELVEG